MKTILSTLAMLSLAAACGDDDHQPPTTATSYALASVVIDAEGTRTTYVQVVDGLDGPFDNARAIELPGNGVVMAHGPHIFVGLAEEPTWVRYTVDATGKVAESGRLSLLNTGVTYIDYGNAIVDDNTAVTVLSEVPSAIIWNPSTMEITGEIDLPHLVREGFSVEVWTTVARDGLVYIPGRWADWEGGRIYPGVSTTIIDPVAKSIVAVAEDNRCASGGRAVFDEAGDLYVMGDGRTYSIHMFANARGETAPDNCLLRIKAGQTTYDPDYFYTIPSLTGGRQSIGELESPANGSGIGFAKMFHPDHLPPGVEPVDFAFWSVPAHKLWRLELADPPRAVEVQGIPFSTVGFEGSALDGKLYTGEGGDTQSSQVYETDPATNTAVLRFTMAGYFYGLYRLNP
ncbi:MAG: hypothetical protein KIT31_38070 [Deltaproteobacteria bacterium]|nr:hypothetical protein [Deltaproteobacteria bacterium]